MVKIYTARVDYRASDKLDTTMKSASTEQGKVLAPTKQMVYGHKRGQGDERFNAYAPLTDAEYIEQYKSLLRTRYARNKQLFLDILQRDEVTLLCFCGKGKFCHRHLAADILKQIADAHHIECELCGERP